MNTIKDIPKSVRWILEVVTLGLLALYVIDILMPAAPHIAAALVVLWAIKRFVPDSLVGKLWKKRQSKPAKAPKATAPAAPAPPSPTTAAVVNGGVRPRYHHHHRRP